MTYNAENLILISVDTDTGTNQEFWWLGRSAEEAYLEVADGGELTLLVDSFSVETDGHSVDPVSPSQPDTPVTSDFLARPSDDPFIDVDITPPPAP